MCVQSRRAPLERAEAHLNRHVLGVVRLEEDDARAEGLHPRDELVDGVDAAVVNEEDAPRAREGRHLRKLRRHGVDG